MSHNEWLEDQLKVVYLKSKVIKEGGFIKLIDTPFKGVSIKYANQLYVDFKDFDLIDFSSLEIYLKPRIIEDDIRIYSNSKNKTLSFYFDKKFNSGKSGEFDKGMWLFNIIKNIVDNLKIPVNKIINCS